MTHSNYEYDTDLSVSISKLVQRSMTNFSAYPGSLISKLSIIDVPYGQKQIRRKIRMPEEEVKVDRAFNPPEKHPDKEMQVIDLACISDRIQVDRADLAGDPEVVSGYVTDIGENFLQALELLVCAGNTRPLVYGITDVPGATTGTIGRPETCTIPTTAGKWDVAGNMNTDLSSLDKALEDQKFYGEKLLVAPPLLKSWLANQQLTYTGTNLASWISNVAGYPIAYSPFIDPDATIDTLDLYMIDPRKIHVAMGPVKVDAYYNQKDHAYYFDYELYATVVPDVRKNSTEWVKPVVKVIVDLTT